QDLNQDPLACAARTGNVGEVLRLLEQGQNPNRGDELGETPLFEAAACGSVEVVAALLVHRADPEQTSFSGGLAADLATEPVTKTLLATYAGLPVSDEEKANCCKAIEDDELREAVANRFRAEMFRGSVLPRYMQKLRA
ncbi:Ankyrin-1 (ANK-1) (Erythrocyte ankyrin), partial [Durusdinium trenchii]